MSDVYLDVYLFFKGQCREAMEFYKSVFGGELELQTYKEANVPGMGGQPNWIMHATLDGDDVKLMASDTEQASDKAAKITLSLGGTDEQRLRDVFGKLKLGGDVRTELKKEFWGDIYGQLTDKFGVEWMVNITAPKE